MCVACNNEYNTKVLDFEQIHNASKRLRQAGKSVEGSREGNPGGISETTGRACGNAIQRSCQADAERDHMLPMLEMDFVLETVALPVKNRGISLRGEMLIRSSQGTHYTSLKSMQLAKGSNPHRSMSRR